MEIEYRLTPPQPDGPPIFTQTKRGLLRGHALLFSNVYPFGWFDERISPNALEGCDLEDVVALFNHDLNLVLGRTVSKTLKVGQDQYGLWYEAKLPNTTAGNDIHELLTRGDVFQSSFSFILGEDSWEQLPNKRPTRTIEKLQRIQDVSAVVFPASPQTSAYAESLGSSARASYDAWAKVNQPDDEWERIHKHRELIMARDAELLAALAAKPWTPTVGLSDEDYERMERTMVRDAEVQLLKMKGQRALDAQIDATLARMQAEMDAYKPKPFIFSNNAR
jgi:HK97 family phage prohead protease